MPTVHFNLADGSCVSAAAEPGDSVMRVARRHHVEAIWAECGGTCSCATCHVHVDPQWVAKLPAMDAVETDMLEFAEQVDATSRLSCQIVMTEELNGLVVNVPASQY